MLFRSVPLVLTLVRSPVLLAWAKPVEVNPANFVGDPRLASLTVGLAGPLTNLVLALGLTLVLRACCIRLRRGPRRRWVRMALVYGIIWNSMLMVFNFLPIPPLDGFRLVTYVFPGVEEAPLLHSFGMELVLLAAVLFVAQRFLVRPMTRVADALLGWAEAPARQGAA